MQVFVAGPFIELDKPVSDPVNSESDPKKVRYDLATYLQSLGHVVYLGEDVEMRKLGRQNFGKYSNAVIYERNYIVKHCNAVVALPSSPGSFCEIGDWVSTTNTCGKLLMFIEDRYRKQLNYINEGVVKQALRHGAKVDYVSFKNLAGIRRKVENFLQSIDQSRQAEDLYGR
jgi:hypothetical protein